VIQIDPPSPKFLVVRPEFALLWTKSVKDESCQILQMELNVLGSLHYRNITGPYMPFRCSLLPSKHLGTGLAKQEVAFSQAQESDETEDLGKPMDDRRPTLKLHMDTTATEVDRHTWNESLHSFQHSLFIRSEWLEALADDNHKPIYLDFTNHGQRIGKIAGLIAKDSLLEGKKLFFYAGPALEQTNFEIYHDCFEALLRLAAKRRFARIIVSSCDQQNAFEVNSRYIPNKRTEFIIPLNSGHNPFKEFSNRFKRTVNKGRETGALCVQTNSTETLNVLARLLGETFKRRVKKYGSKYNPYYLPYLTETSLYKLLESGLLQLSHTFSNSTIHAIEANLTNGTQAYNLLKASDETGYKLGLSSFLSFKSVETLSQLNYSYYNLGGTISSSDGLTVFKKSMGAKPVTVYGARTDYLIFPYVLLNPLLKARRNLHRKSAFRNLKNFLQKAVKRN
jgi:hypothetical protein